MLTPYLATFVTQTKFAAEIEMSPKLTRVFRRRRIFTKERSESRWHDFVKKQNTNSLFSGTYAWRHLTTALLATEARDHYVTQIRIIVMKRMKREILVLKFPLKFVLLEFGWLSSVSLIFFGWSCRIVKHYLSKIYFKLNSFLVVSQLISLPQKTKNLFFLSRIKHTNYKQFCVLFFKTN